VYLQVRYLLTQRIDDGKYEYFEYQHELFDSYYTKIRFENDGTIGHGPASTRYYNAESSRLPTDYVRCIRCLSWPLQAADWPTRYRYCGWPDLATLDRVVNNRCDLVGVAHRQCRQHEWMGKCQFRLSFSRAEIVLINSWMPVQQIVYHILRVYVKTERLTESVDNSEPAIMSNYHIKTLMLWACELKLRSWWTENLNLVRICAELLNTLSVWLSDIRCPHYFINNCNLLDTPLSDAEVTSKLMSIDETYLSTWLINNYIGRCAQLCPSYISRLCDDVSNGMKLQQVVSQIVRWRLDTSLLEMWLENDFVDIFIPLEVNDDSLTVRACVCWINELTKMDKRFSVYILAVALLHVSRRVSRNGFSDQWMDVLSTLLGPNFNQHYSFLSRCKSEVNKSELVDLL